MKDTIISAHRIELFSIIIVFLDIFFNILPALPLAIAITALAFVRLNVVGVIPLTIVAMPQFFGALMNSYGIRGIGGIFMVVGLLLFLYVYLKKLVKFSNIKKCILPLLLFVGICGLSISLTTGGDYALTKYINTVSTCFLSFIAYITLFSFSEKINYTRLGLYFILFAFLLLRVSYIVNGGNPPTNILDFGFMRIGNKMSGTVEGDFLLDYQFPGFIALNGLSIILMASWKEHTRVPFILFLFFFCSLLCLYCGARQFVVIAFVLLLTWLIIGLKDKGGIRFTLVALFSFVLIPLSSILLSNDGMFNSVAESGYLEGSNRELPLALGLSYFIENPVFGIGYGRFNIFGTYGVWPHNLFIEILCEMGILGLTVFLVICVKPMIKEKFFFRYYSYLFLVLFLRSMVSCGMDANVAILSYCVALYTLSHQIVELI